MNLTFENISGTMILTDPELKYPSWCQAVVPKVKTGKWSVGYDSLHRKDKTLITFLYVYNIAAAMDNLGLISKIDNGEGSDLPFECAVNSGGFNISDLEEFKTKMEPNIRVKPNLGLGLTPNGVAVVAGFGNVNSYTVKGVKDSEGNYVAFSVVFIKQVQDDPEEDNGSEDEETNEED
jgi:hypothetical protein